MLNQSTPEASESREGDHKRLPSRRANHFKRQLESKTNIQVNQPPFPHLAHQAEDIKAK